MGLASQGTQPRHRGEKGVIWDIQASAKPRFEVYQCDHADVLLTEIPKKTRSGPKPSGDLRASQRTLEALTAESSEGPVDPLVANDPWGKYSKPVAKVAKVDPLSPQQIDVLAAAVQHRVEASLSSSSAHPVAQDVQMDDTKAAEIDARLQQLEKGLQHQEQATQAMRTDIDAKFHAVHHQHEALKTHVDKQSVLIQQHMDTRMAEQLHHIERILAAQKESSDATEPKRAKMDQE